MRSVEGAELQNILVGEVRLKIKPSKLLCLLAVNYASARWEHNADEKSPRTSNASHFGPARLVARGRPTFRSQKSNNGDVSRIDACQEGRPSLDLERSKATTGGSVIQLARS